MQAHGDIYCFSDVKFEIPKNLYPSKNYKFIEFDEKSRNKGAKNLNFKDLDVNQDFSFAFFDILRMAKSEYKYCHIFRDYNPSILSFLLSALNFNKICKFDKQILSLVHLEVLHKKIEYVYMGRIFLNEYEPYMHKILFSNKQTRKACMKSIENLNNLHAAATNSVVSQMEAEFSI
jgi:hypothetical protein